MSYLLYKWIEESGLLIENDQREIQVMPNPNTQSDQHNHSNLDYMWHIYHPSGTLPTWIILIK